MTDAQTLPAHIQRVVAEKIDLDIRLNNLISFIETSVFFQGLLKEEKDLLQAQRVTMTEFSSLLGKRINLYMIKNKET